MDKQRRFDRFNRVNAKLSILFFLFLYFLVGCSIDEDEEMGSLSLKLSSDFSITAVTKAEPKTSEVGPSVHDFRVEVYQGEAGTSLFKRWDSFADMASEVNLPQNVYVLKAIFGEQHKGAFETPYYEGTTPFSIVKRKNTSVSAVCKIANTKVTLEYSDGFKNYFKDWSAKVASTGDSLTFAKEETRGAYFEPGQVGMNLTMTRQDGKTITYAPPTVATEGGKHYRFRLDVTTGGAGGVNLVIRFDKTTEEKPIYVDISGDNPVIISPPYISATGFSNGMPITVAEGASAGKIYTLVNARGKIKSCVLRTESLSLLDEGWPASVDLADASADVSELEDKIIFTSGMKGAQMAEIDFTNLIPFLKASSQTTLQHTFTLEVTDDAGKKNEAFTLVAQMAVPGFKLLKLENVNTDGTSAEGTAHVRFEMTTGDPAKIRVQAKDDYGIWSDLEWVSGIEPKLTSVVNVYLGTIKIRVEDKKELRLNYNDEARISNSEYLYGGKYSFELEMADGQPADGATNPYVWATKAYVKIKDNTVNPYKLSFRKNDQDGDELEKEILMDNTILIKGLDAGTKNRVVAVVKDAVAQSNPFVIKTEEGLQLPNSGFEKFEVKNSFSNILIGGKVGYTYLYKDLGWPFPTKTATVSKQEKKSSLENISMDSWANLNDKTMPIKNSNLNTWYIVPSCYSSSGYGTGNCAVIRNVKWSNQGETVRDNNFYEGGWAGKLLTPLASGAKGVPNPPQIKYQSIGELFLGTYDCTHDENNGGISKETKTEGWKISSRPTALKGFFKYNPENASEKGLVVVRLLNDELEVGYGEYYFDNQDSFSEFVLNIKYSNMEAKANRISVKFLATGNMDVSQVTCTNNISYGGNEKYDDAVTNSDAMTCTGSELYIDDLKLIYE